MLLLDNSAWSRIVAGVLDQERAAEVASWTEAGQLATCLPFLLEAGYSARSAADHKQILDDLRLYPRVRIGVQAEERAERAQSELAAIGHHRLSPPDIIIAACAHEAGAGVLHYDADYDVLASRTSLQFESVWLAPPGTL